MRLRDVAFANLRRRRGRTVFLVLSLSVGVALMVAVVSITVAMRGSVESRLREFGANMVVMPQTLQMPIMYGGVNLGEVQAAVGELTEEDATLVASIQRKDALRGVSPKLVGAVRVDGKELMVVGVRFRDELRMKPWWHLQGEKPSLSRDVILGADAATELGKSASDAVVIGGKEFRVTAVLDRQSSAEDRAVFADLRETGELLGKPGRISFIEVSTWCAACPVETIVEQVSAKVPHARVFAVKQLVEAELAQVELVSGFALVLTAVILLVGSVIMLLTMMASVRERTREIGVLRAIGFRQSHIAKLILLEGATISVASSLIGAAAGSVAGVLLSRSYAVVDVPVLDLRYVAIAVVLSVIMGTLPTLYSARRAARLDPATALRAI